MLVNMIDRKVVWKWDRCREPMPSYVRVDNNIYLIFWMAGGVISLPNGIHGEYKHISRDETGNTSTAVLWLHIPRK